MATPADWAAGVAQAQQKAATMAGLDATTVQVLQQYGYLAAYLNQPEIGPLLREAAKEGWSKDVLQGRLYNTQWWQTRTAADRELETLKATDPAEYNARVNDKAAWVQQQAQQAGEGFSNFDDAMTVAKNILADPSLDQQTINFMIFAHAQYTGKTPQGTMGASMDSVKKTAADYFVPLSDEAAFNWSKRIAMNTATPESAEEYMKTQAKSKFGYLADDIDRGFTVKDLFDPYIQQTAQLLEKSPDQINLMDPKYANMVQTKDPTTGKNRAMTLSEAGDYVRASDEYDHTQQAMNKVGAFTNTMETTFGKVKT